MGAQRPFLARARRHPVLTASVAVFVLAAVLLLVARVWISSDGGHRFIQSQINGRDIAGFGNISVNGLDGDPLSSPRLARLTLSDSEGVWLEVESVRLTWSPAGLLRRHVNIKSLGVSTIRVIRRPVRGTQVPGGDSDWSLALSDLRIDNLIIEQGVGGVASRSSVEGRMNRDAEGGSVLSFALKPQESGGDRIDLEANWGGDRELELRLDAASPAGGALGALAGIDPSSAVELQATAAGSFANAIGEANLKIGNHDTIIAAGKIESGELVATARVNAEHLPLPDDWREVIGTDADAALSANITGDRAAFVLDGRLASGEINLAGEFDIGERRLVDPLTIEADLSSLAPFSDLPIGVAFGGVISNLHDGPVFVGDVRAVVREGSPYPLEAAAGTVQVGPVGDDIAFAVDLTGFGLLSGNSRALAVFGETPQVKARGVYSVDAKLLTLTEATVSTPGAQVSGAGEANLESRTVDLSGMLDMDLGDLVEGTSGRAKGIYRAEGPSDAIRVSTSLGLTSLTGFPDLVDPLVAGNSRLDMALTVEGAAVKARTLRFRSDGVDATASGMLAGAKGQDVSFEGTQKLPVSLGGTVVNLGQFRGSIVTRNGGWRIAATSEGGMLTSGDRTVQSISSQIDLTLADEMISGPVEVRGLSDGTPLSIAGDLSRGASETLLSGIVGKFGTLGFTGEASQSEASGIIVNVSGNARGLTLPGGFADAASFSLRGVQAPGAPLAIVASVSARAMVIDGFGPIDTLNAELNSAGQGYAYTASIVSTQPRRPLDLQLKGRADSRVDGFSGTFDLSGSALGAPVSSRTPVTWVTRPVPSFSADIAFLGGRLQTELSNDTPVPTLEFALDRVEAQPVFAAVGMPDLSATIGGQGRFQPFGLTPTGNFKLQTSSDVAGLGTSVLMNIDGSLDAGALRLSGKAVYGGRLSVFADGAIPVAVAPQGFVTFDRSASLKGTATLAGDLSSLRTAAQAYGQDIGGTVDGKAVLSGTLAKPKARATVNVTDGIYELGLTGLRLVGLTISAGLANGTLSVDATGAGANGGALKAKGEIRPGAGEINGELTRLLIYERSGNSVRVTGPLVMTETESARLISGTVTINDARVSLDTLPSSQTRAIAIRWQESPESDDTRPVLEKPLKIDIQAEAPGRIMISGRGLTSEWGVNVRATGIPTNPSLDGTATLVRGELDVAGRPFLFDRGIVRFDGPIDAARVDLSAQRSVNGFSARMDVTGPPAAPRFVFTSTPELPQDEILSRLLFGRSSVDLSALEAAQLAATVARLSGRGSVFDPLGQLQAAIGLDRLSVGLGESGETEVGVGQYIADSVYLELKSAGASGNAVLLEWEPAPQIAVTSETRINGDTRLSIRWKKDYD